MKNRINKWLDTPITWRSSCKASLVGMGISTLAALGMYIYVKIDDRRRAKELEEEFE